MILPLFRVSLLLTLLFTTGIIILLDLPYKNSGAEAFMTAPENCGGTCLLGIQPGISRLGETMIQLRSHPWVGEVVQNAPGTGYAQITWQWSGQQPGVINASRDGLITFYWDDDFSQPALADAIIETITIHTHFRIYSLQTWLGEALTGAATLRPNNDLGYLVVYDIPGGMINLSVEMPCPVDLLSYWNARTRLTMSIGRIRNPFVPALEMVKLC